MTLLSSKEGSNKSDIYFFHFKEIFSYYICHLFMASLLSCLRQGNWLHKLPTCWIVFPILHVY